MSSVEGEDGFIAVAASTPKARRRRLRGMLLAALTAQYTIVAAMVGISLAVTLHYGVTPQIVDKFEAIAAALKR
jgi:hypothetical protein